MIPRSFFGRTFNAPDFVDILIVNSTAELSSGLICTCLPTIPALFQRRRRSRSDKTLEENSHSRHLRVLTRKQPTNLSDQEPFNGEYLELSEGRSQNEGFEALPAAVATDIEGGNPSSVQATNPLSLGAREDDLISGPAIMKTVVVEQSHNVRR